MKARLRRSYQLLGLQPGVRPDELRAAYRDLAKVWHPDRFAGDTRLRRVAEDKLRDINEAYQALREAIGDRVADRSRLDEAVAPEWSAEDGSRVPAALVSLARPRIGPFERSHVLTGAGLMLALGLAAFVATESGWPGEWPAPSDGLHAMLSRTAGYGRSLLDRVLSSSRASRPRVFVPPPGVPVVKAYGTHFQPPRPAASKPKPARPLKGPLLRAWVKGGVPDEPVGPPIEDAQIAGAPLPDPAAARTESAAHPRRRSPSPNPQ